MRSAIGPPWEPRPTKPTRITRAKVQAAFTQMAEYEPLVIERAEGCRLIDIDGRSYLDGASSMWCNVHGHNHPHIRPGGAEGYAQLAASRKLHLQTLGGLNSGSLSEAGQS